MMRRLLLPLLLLAAFAANAAPITIVLPNGLTVVPAVTISPNGGSFGAAQGVTLTESLSGSTIWYIEDGTIPTPTNGTSCTSPCSITISTSLVLNVIAVKTGLAGSILSTATFTVTIAPTANPNFSIAAGTSPTPWTVGVTDITSLAVIYCTQDGSTPTTASTVYTAPFTFGSGTVASTTTLKCLAKAPSLAASGVVTGVYVYAPPAVSPVISPGGSTYTSTVTVSIANSCSGETTYVTQDGTTPTTSSTVYTTPIVLTVSKVITAMSTCPNYAQSAVVSQSYIIVPPAAAPTPTFVPSSTSSPTSFGITINDGAAGSTGFYTTDGTTPTPTHGTSCSIPCSLTVSVSEVVQAMVTASGFSPSLVGSATYTITGGGTLGSCPSSSGPLTVVVSSPRVVGISPLEVFFNATATTESGSTTMANNTTTFQDVTYTWNFGDSGSSGSGHWAYGSNAGGNSKNFATGGITAHLFVATPGGGDYSAGGPNPQFQGTVTATDGTNTTSCNLPPVTAYDPSGTNGFGGLATTCVSAAATPVPGVAGCPAGATPLKTAALATALSGTYIGSNKRVLFHCGETFTGTNANLAGTKWRVGAYGGCEDTATNRPIFQVTGTGGLITLNGNSAAPTDWAISDIDLEGSASVVSAGVAISTGGNNYPFQGTIYNVLSNKNAGGFYDFGAAQMALIGFVQSNATSNSTVVNFINDSENQCANGSSAYQCGQGGSAVYRSNDYWAIMGSSFDGLGITGSQNYEVVRISAMRFGVISNNVIKNALNGGAPLKLHSGNPNSVANAPWIGQYTENIMLSDNLFTGKSGAQLVEIAPQNGVTDERLRNIVFERNLVIGTSGSSCRVIASVQNASFRDNVFNCTATSGSLFGLQIGKRGIEWTGTTGAPVIAAEPQYNEAYNNTVYGATGIGFSGQTFAAPGNNGWCMNNLMYNPSGGGTTCTNTGSGNTVSNNSSPVTNNPGFVNATTTFSLLSDFESTTANSGATSVPDFYDGNLSASFPFGTPWSPTWFLGAIHP